jgi:hypothetical protein
VRCRKIRQGDTKLSFYRRELSATEKIKLQTRVHSVQNPAQGLEGSPLTVQKCLKTKTKNQND